MAEPENLDDEFFVDLYDDNDGAPNAAAPQAEQAEEPMGDAPDLGEQEQDTYTETREHDGNGDAHAMNEEEEEEEEEDDDIDFNLGNTATHVPTAGIPSHQDSPTPSTSAPPPPQPPPQQSSHQQGHQKNSNSKEDG